MGQPLAFDQTFVIAAVINFVVKKKCHSLMTASCLKDFADFALTKGAKKASQTAESIFSSNRPAVLTLFLEVKMQASASEWICSVCRLLWQPVCLSASYTVRDSKAPFRPAGMGKISNKFPGCVVLEPFSLQFRKLDLNHFLQRSPTEFLRN